MLWMQRNRKIKKDKDSVFYVRGRRVEGSKLARYARRKKELEHLEVRHVQNCKSSYLYSRYRTSVLIIHAAIPPDIRCYTPAPRLPPTPRAPIDEQPHGNSFPLISNSENQSINAERSQSPTHVPTNVRSATSLHEPCHTYPQVPLELPVVRSPVMAKAPNRSNMPTHHKRNDPVIPKGHVSHTQVLEHLPPTLPYPVEEGEILPKATIELVSGTSARGLFSHDLQRNTDVDTEKSVYNVSSVEENEHCHGGLFNEMLHAQISSIGDLYHSTYRDMLLTQTLSTARRRRWATRSASPSFAMPTKAFTPGSSNSRQEGTDSLEGFIESIHPSHLTVDQHEPPNSGDDTTSRHTKRLNRKRPKPRSLPYVHQAPRSEHQAYTMQYAKSNGAPSQSNRHLALMESAIEARVTKLKGQTPKKQGFLALEL